MVRSGLLPLAAAAAFLGLTAHAAPTTTIETIPFATVRPAGSEPISLGNESVSSATVPLGSPPVAAYPVAAGGDARALRENPDEASEPSVLAMMVAGLAMIGFIVARRYGVS